MNEKVSELLGLTRKLLDQSMELVNNSLPSIESVPAEDVRYSIFLRVQMSEALKFGYGAYYSCYHGWGHGGIGAARSIYEILLDLKYINQDEARKKERFTRFLDHGAEYFYHEMEIISQLGQEVFQEDQDARTNTYKRLKKKYNDKHKQDIELGISKADATPRYRKYNWAGLDLSQKVEEVNLKQLHQFYKNLSNLSHVSIGATLDAIENSTENQIKVDLNLYPGLEHCYFVLIMVFLCVFRILEEYMEYFGIERFRYPNLGKIEEDCKKLLR